MRISLFVLFVLFTLNPVIAQDSPTQTYDQMLAQIKKDRYHLLIQSVSKDSCRSYLLDCFENKVFPYWVGTQWDYNGYTNRPGKDKLIACGYFVSTTLKHIGFNWNRFDLAKMYSLKIVENTCSDIKKYTDKQELIKYILSQPNNLYIVGLDSHVGFLLKSHDIVWFVHSNYYGAGGPEKELASVSQALDDSQSYHVGTFFNDTNIDKWLTKEVYNFDK